MSILNQKPMLPAQFVTIKKGDKVRFNKWTVLLAPKMFLQRPEVVLH